MNAKELQDIIRRGETSTVQFKEIFTNQKDFSKEIVAMANSLGGIIVIGVKDKTGEIRGLDYKEIQEWSSEIGNAANEQIRPTVYLQTEVVDVENKMLLLVHVKEGANKPYKDLNGSIWIKQSADKRKITDNGEILRLFAQSGTFRADSQIVAGTTLGDLDMYRIDDFFERVYRKSKDKFGIPFEQLMQNLRIADGNGSLTLSGLLFFGKHPQQFVPEFCVKAVAFYGNSIGGSEYRDSKDITGTIPDMYEQCLRFCEMNLHRIQAGQNFNSVGKLEVSQIAIEEIVQNALVHRDYIIPAAIRLLIFGNRIEIVSPGSLPHGMTTDLLRMGVSCPRNPLMATFCAKSMPYRGLGSGIIRAEQDGAEMEFQNIDNIQLTTILKRKETENDTTENGTYGTVNGSYNTENGTNGIENGTNGIGNDTYGTNDAIKNLTKKQGDILKLIEDDPDISIEELTLSTNVSRRTILRDIKVLRDLGIVSRKGRKKDGTWVVNLNKNE